MATDDFQRLAFSAKPAVGSALPTRPEQPPPLAFVSVHEDQALEVASYAFSTRFNSLRKPGGTIRSPEPARMIGLPVRGHTVYLLLKPVFTAEFSDVVTSLGVSVVFGRIHQIASDV